MGQNTKKVVVLGSAPNASWEHADIIYCANGAIGFYANELSEVKHVINVVSARVLNKSHTAYLKSTSNIYTSKFDAICKATPSKIILVESFARNGLSTELQNWLKRYGYQSPIEILDPSTRIHLQQKLAGLPYPLPLTEIIKSMDLRALRDTLYLLPYRLGLKKNEASSRFRPSTGIVALLIAIRDHGHNAEYVIAGIGLTHRDAHQGIHSQIDNASSDLPSKKPRLPPHILADRLIIHALARKFKMHSANPEISELINSK